MAATVEIRVEFKRTGESPQAVADSVRSVGNAANESVGGFNALSGAASVAFGNIASSAAMAAGAMAAQFIGGSIDTAAQFQSNMNLFSAAAGGSLEAAGLSVKEFESLFLELGSTLPVSTVEVQEAATAMIKGGIDPATVASGGLRDTLLFAAAAGMDLEGAAEISAKALGAFGAHAETAEEKAEFLAEAQNLLVKAANSSTVDVEAMGNAMLSASGQINAMGVDFEDSTVAMAGMIHAFPSAAEAGTSYKNFLVRLNPTTEAAKDTMMALGLMTEDGANAFFSATGEFLGNRNAAEQLQTALSGLSDQERIMALQTIFGNDAMGAASEMARMGMEGYDAMAASMATANGVAEQGAAVQQGFEFAMEELSGTIEVVQIKLGTALLPVLEYFVGITTNVINALMGSEEAFASLPAPIQTVITIGQSFVSWIGNLISQVQTVGAQSATWQDILTKWVSEGVPLAIGKLGEFVNMITGWIGENLPKLVEGMAQWGKELFEWVIEAMPQMLANLLLIAEGIQNWLITNLPPIVAKLAEWGMAFAAWVLTEALPKLIVALGELFAQFLLWVAGRIPVLVEAIKEWVPAITQWAIDAIPVLLGNIGTFFTELATAITERIEAITSDGNTVGGAIINGITSGVSAGVGALASAVQNAAAEALRRAKEFLGIRSPSRVFADVVGGPIVQGIAAGINEQSSLASQAIESALQTTLFAAQSAIDTSPALNGIAAMGIEPMMSVGGVGSTLTSGQSINNVTQNISYAPSYLSGGGGMADVGMLRTLARGL